jgi:hypothetical protein
MENIEDTEAARIAFVTGSERRRKKPPAPGQLISQATGKRVGQRGGGGDDDTQSLNFGRARFLSGGKHDFASRGTSIGVVDSKETELTDHTRIFEQAKKAGFESGVRCCSCLWQESLLLEECCWNLLLLL